MTTTTEPAVAALAAWHFDEGDGAIAHDAGALAKDGTVNGATWSRQGRIGPALQFDGVDDYVDVVPGDELYPPEVTVGAWVWLAQDPAGPGTVLLNGTGEGVTWSYYFQILEDARVQFSVFPNSIVRVDSTHPLEVERWYHIAGTYEAATGETRLYIDGAPDASASGSGNLKHIHANQRLTIGANYYMTELRNAFAGIIDEVAIHDRPLTADEVAAWYAAAPAPPAAPPPDLLAQWRFDDPAAESAIDSSGRDHHAAIHGAVPVAGQVGQARWFDGADDYLEAAYAADLYPSDAVTVEAWVKPDSIGQQRSILMAGRAEGVTWSYYLLLADTGVARFGVFASQIAYVAGSTVLTPGTWHHVAGTYDAAAGKVSIYVDGALEGTKAAGGALRQVGSPLTIGANFYMSELRNPFAGAIDEVAVFGRALAEAEILEHAQALPGAPPEIVELFVPDIPLRAGTTVAAVAMFVDPDSAGGLTAEWSWGDGSTAAGDVSFAGGIGTVIGTHAYHDAGLHAVTLTLFDERGASHRADAAVRVFDPAAGYVTARGDCGFEGFDAEVSCEVRYVPEQLLRPAGSFAITRDGEDGFRFEADGFDYLLVDGPSARFAGTGFVTGVSPGPCRFLVAAHDGQHPEGGGADLVRIKLWRDGGEVVLDNQPRSPDDAEPTQELKPIGIKVRRV